MLGHKKVIMSLTGWYFQYKVTLFLVDLSLDLKGFISIFMLIRVFSVKKDLIWQTHVGTFKLDKTLNQIY